MPNNHKPKKHTIIFYVFSNSLFVLLFLLLTHLTVVAAADEHVGVLWIELDADERRDGLERQLGLVRILCVIFQSKQQQHNICQLV